MIYVITSIIGGFDNLRPPLVPAEPGVRWICFTDLPLIPSVPPWEFRPVINMGHAGRSSRVPKILPHLMLPADADYSIWHDANFQLILPPRDIIGRLLKSRDWAAHKHPARDCPYKEAEVLLSEKIGTPELVRAEIARYREMSYPPIAGLWANGFIVRRHTPAVAALNENWWKMYAEGCERDQLSFPVARCVSGLEIESIPDDVYRSPYIKFNWHAAWKNKDDNPSYWPERARLRAQAEALARVTGVACPFPVY